MYCNCDSVVANNRYFFKLKINRKINSIAEKCNRKSPYILEDGSKNNVFICVFKFS